MRIDVYHHLPQECSGCAIQTTLSIILARINSLGVTMSAELDALTAKVQEAISVEESAIALINGLAVQIAALKNDPVALQALADSLGAETASLSAAVTANTPTT